MPRIFLCLSSGQLLVLVGTGVLGLIPGAAAPDRHILLAVFTLLLSCLIQMIVFTYLTVSRKMLAQAVHRGRLGLGPVVAAKRLSGSMIRLVGLLTGAIVVVTATGAHHWRTGQGGGIHFAAAAVIMLAHVYVFYREFGLVCENTALVEQTLHAYRRSTALPRLRPGAPTAAPRAE